MKKAPSTESAFSRVSVGSKELFEARRRYANARRRARYWSGTPHYDVRVRSNETRSWRLNEKYGLAMCDCKNWEITIEHLTGKKVEHYDPKRTFAAKFYKLMASNAQVERRAPSTFAPTPGSAK